MNSIKKLNYLFNNKIKINAIILMIVIFIGSLMELIGVYIILPIVNLAIEENALETNKICRTIVSLTGWNDRERILLFLILGTVLVYVFKNLYLIWMSYRMNVFSKGVKQYYATCLMESYMKQPYVYFLNKNTSDILRTLNNDTVNLYAVIANAMQVLSQGITAVLIAGGLLITNPGMTIVVVGLLGICTCFIIFFLQKKIRRMGKENQKLSSYIIEYERQAFSGIKEIKVRNKEKIFIERYTDTYDKSAEIEKTYSLLSILPKYLIETICIGGIMSYLAVLILTGGNLAVIVPQLAVFVVAAFKLLPSINAIYINFSTMLYHKASIDAIYHDIKEVEKSEVDFTQKIEQKRFGEFQDRIVLKNVSFTYENRSKKVLNNITLEIPKGESIAFVGESGGGKTTLVDIILGLLTPQEGNVYVDGKNIYEDVRGWHERIGYIPQQIFLMDDSIRKNVAFGVEDKYIEDSRIWDALEKAQMKEFVERLEDGLDTTVGEGGTRLSGGQRQRIGIARALYHNPDILVFDEATSALDSETEKEVMRAIDGLHGMKTMIMIAHRLSTIEKCDMVYKVENQRVNQIR